MRNFVCPYYFLKHIGQRSHTDEKTGSLSKTGMKITAKKEKDCILKLISKPELQQTLTMTQDYSCCHMSYMTSDRILISCRCHLLLINKKGKTIYQKHDLFCHSSIDGSGRHAVNNENNVFYIRNKTDVYKLSKNWKSTHFLKTNSSLKPSCVHWSTITNELLVGMYRKKTMTGMVFRYNPSGQLTQKIQHDNSGLDIYINPNYITENNNGDIVVSEFIHWTGAVVVTDREGRYRFSYTGRQKGSKFWPKGICTDELSHILVCDTLNHSIHMIHMDGQFLCYLQTKFILSDPPISLTYDFNMNRLWVGYKYSNTMYAYRYTTQENAVTGKY